LTASGSPNYTWSTGGLLNIEIITATAGAVYSVTGTAANGCTTTKTHPVQVSPAPIFTITSTDTIVCPKTQISLFGAGADTFTWEPGSIAGYTFTQMFSA